MISTFYENKQILQKPILRTVKTTSFIIKRKQLAPLNSTKYKR